VREAELNTLISEPILSFHREEMKEDGEIDEVVATTTKGDVVNDKKIIVLQRQQ